MPTSEPAIDHFLKRLEGQTLGWAAYLAPDGLKQNLQAIPKRLDPAFRTALEQSGQKMWEQPLEQAPGIPMVLFHGPPGTGKTFAMRVLASQAKLDAWTLDIVGLQERSQTPEKLFVDILERIENMRDAIIFIDECEALFSSGAVTSWRSTRRSMWRHKRRRSPTSSSGLRVWKRNQTGKADVFSCA